MRRSEVCSRRVFPCVLAAVTALGLAGCVAPPDPSPEPPKGQGWILISQGHNLLQMSSSSDGNGNTQSQASSGYSNMKQNERLSSEDVERQLRAGANVADFTYNTHLGGTKP